MILAALSERGTPYPALKQDARGRTVMHYAVVPSRTVRLNA